MRADVNLSVRKPGQEYGTRTEMKNMNSFKAIHRAVLYEAGRQIGVLKRGGAVVQETRRWDDNKDASFSMRTKENAQDYRYFPEPDLLPLEISRDWIGQIRRELPELPAEKRARYRSEYGLPEYDAEILTSSREIAALFEEVTRLCGKPKEAANLIMVDLMRLLGDTGTLPEEMRVGADRIASLINLITGGRINRNTGKEVLEQIFKKDVDPEAYVMEKGLLMLSDDSLVSDAADRVLRENAKSVEDFAGGKEKAFGFLVGQVMKTLQGKANPQDVNRILREKLSQICN